MNCIQMRETHSHSQNGILHNSYIFQIGIAQTIVHLQADKLKKQKMSIAFKNVLYLMQDPYVKRNNVWQKIMVTVFLYCALWCILFSSNYFYIHKKRTFKQMFVECASQKENKDLNSKWECEIANSVKLTRIRWLRHCTALFTMLWTSTANIFGLFCFISNWLHLKSAHRSKQRFKLNGLFVNE